MKFRELVEKYGGRVRYMESEIERSYLSVEEKERTKGLWVNLLSTSLLDGRDYGIEIDLVRYEGYVYVFGRSGSRLDEVDLSFLCWEDWMELDIGDRLLKVESEEDLLIYGLQQMGVWGVSKEMWEMNMGRLDVYELGEVFQENGEGYGHGR